MRVLPTGGADNRAGNHRDVEMGTVMKGEYAEPVGDFRVPSRYARCRRQHCTEIPVTDMLRVGRHITWWAYCATHLADYNREVRDGVVWWKGWHE